MQGHCTGARGWQPLYHTVTGVQKLLKLARMLDKRRRLNTKKLHTVAAAVPDGSAIAVPGGIMPRWLVVRSP